MRFPNLIIRAAYLLPVLFSALSTLSGSYMLVAIRKSEN